MPQFVIIKNVAVKPAHVVAVGTFTQENGRNVEDTYGLSIWLTSTPTPIVNVYDNQEECLADYNKLIEPTEE